MPRRQELPEEAFLSPQQVRDLSRGHLGTECESCTCCVPPSQEAPLRLVSISHGWLTQDHPDPYGEQLVTFADQIAYERSLCTGSYADLAMRGAIFFGCCGLGEGCCCFVPFCGQQCGKTANQFPPGEFSVFYDWGSLHHKDLLGRRTADEEKCFKEALRTMGVWYAHRLETTFVLSELPTRWPRDAKGDRPAC